jgi:hypothetical protein
MAWDVTVYLEDRAGALASLGEAVGKAGVNLEGVCGITVGGRGIIHLLVEDGAALQRMLAAAGFEVGEVREALVAPVADQPGALGTAAGRFAAAGVPLDLVYAATGSRLVFLVQRPEDVYKARQLL